MPVEDVLAVVGRCAVDRASRRANCSEERPITQWLVDTRMVSVAKRSRTLDAGRRVYVNNQRVKDEKRRLGVDDLWQGALAVLAKGSGRSTS